MCTFSIDYLYHLLVDMLHSHITKVKPVYSGHCVLKTATSFLLRPLLVPVVLILCKMTCIMQPPAWNSENKNAGPMATIISLQHTQQVLLYKLHHLKYKWGERAEEVGHGWPLVIKTTEVITNWSWILQGRKFFFSMTDPSLNVDLKTGAYLC